MADNPALAERKAQIIEDQLAAYVLELRQKLTIQLSEFGDYKISINLYINMDTRPGKGLVSRCVTADIGIRKQWRFWSEAVNISLYRYTDGISAAYVTFYEQTLHKALAGFLQAAFKDAGFTVRISSDHGFKSLKS